MNNNFNISNAEDLFKIYQNNLELLRTYEKNCLKLSNLKKELDYNITKSNSFNFLKIISVAFFISIVIALIIFLLCLVYCFCGLLIGSDNFRHIYDDLLSCIPYVEKPSIYVMTNIYNFLTYFGNFVKEQNLLINFLGILILIPLGIFLILFGMYLPFLIFLLPISLVFSIIMCIMSAKNGKKNKIIMKNELELLLKDNDNT